MRKFLRIVVIAWTVLMFALLVYALVTPFLALAQGNVGVSSAVGSQMLYAKLVILAWLVIAVPVLVVYAVWPKPDKSPTPPPAPPSA